MRHGQLIFDFLQEIERVRYTYRLPFRGVNYHSWLPIISIGFSSSIKNLIHQTKLYKGFLLVYVPIFIIVLRYGVVLPCQGLRRGNDRTEASAGNICLWLCRS